jgi:hypothetical protein
MLPKVTVHESNAHYVILISRKGCLFYQNMLYCYLDNK